MLYTFQVILTHRGVISLKYHVNISGAAFPLHIVAIVNDLGGGMLVDCSS
jgi:hypothetical protein